MAKPMPDCPFGLTVSEARTLRAVMTCNGYEEAADQACQARNTLKATMQRVYRKLGVANRVQAAVHAARSGLLPGKTVDPFVLTDTELSVVNLFPEWQGAKQAARDLHVDPSTINWHLRQIYKKLGVNNLLQCAVKVERAGYYKDTQ